MSFAASYCVKFNCTAQTVASTWLFSLSLSLSLCLAVFLRRLFCLPLFFSLTRSLFSFVDQSSQQAADLKESGLFPSSFFPFFSPSSQHTVTPASLCEAVTLSGKGISVCLLDGSMVARLYQTQLLSFISTSFNIWFVFLLLLFYRACIPHGVVEVYMGYGTLSMPHLLLS